MSAAPTGPAAVATLAVLIVLIHGAWLGAGTALARLLRRPRASRIVNLCFAAILVATTLGPLLR